VKKRSTILRRLKLPFPARLVQQERLVILAQLVVLAPAVVEWPFPARLALLERPVILERPVPRALKAAKAKLAATQSFLPKNNLPSSNAWDADHAADDGNIKAGPDISGPAFILQQASAANCNIRLSF